MNKTPTATEIQDDSSRSMSFFFMWRSSRVQRPCQARTTNASTVIDKKISPILLIVLSFLYKIQDQFGFFITEIGDLQWC